MQGKQHPFSTPDGAARHPRGARPFPACLPCVGTPNGCTNPARRNGPAGAWGQTHACCRDRWLCSSLNCLATELCLLQASRLQETSGDRRSSTKICTCLKKKKEGRGRFSRDVTCRFAVQVPAGGTPECAAFLLAWCCSPEESSASALLPASGHSRWL